MGQNTIGTRYNIEQPSPFLHLIIPVYNEGENFEQVYSEIRNNIRTPHDIRVVYDMDEDTTVPVVNKLQQHDHNLLLVKNKFGRGVLNALRTGLDSVQSGLCLVVMGDLSDDLSIVDSMVAKSQEYDIICPSRYMKGGKQIGGPYLKRLFSRIAGLSLYYLAGIPTHDITNNFRLYNKKIFDAISIESEGGFEVAMEITVKAFVQGYTITEVPTTWKDRTTGTSRFKLWKWLPHYLRWYTLALTSNHPKPALRSQVTRFIIVGGMAAFLDLALLYVLTDFLRIHVLLSALVSFTVAATASYFLNLRWIFIGGKHERHIEVLLFFITSFIGVVLTEILLIFFVYSIKLWYILSKVLAIIIISLFNFWLRKKHIFLR